MSEEKITLKSIIKTESELREMGYGINNNIIKYIDVNTIGHFGNSTCFEIMCDNICPMGGYNNTGNIGFLIRAFIELFGITEEDGLRLSKIRNIPCRLIFNQSDCEWGSRCIGFGHFMKDKFVLTEDFAKIRG